MLEWMSGWFTATSLFVLLNLVIGTIWVSSHKNHHQPQPDPPSLLCRVKSFRFNNFSQPADPPSGSVTVTPEEHKVVKRREMKMKRSASEKRWGHEKGEVVERRRPETARVERTPSIGGDAEVDVKADDFINRFKQQLKLQRLDSILRYKDMISRGASR